MLSQLLYSVIHMKKSENVFNEKEGCERNLQSKNLTHLK